ncbi:glycine-N-acyltransferase-like protein 3 [Liolophura sinensis]|uniref:glycine-N-acyltransferase-like protein 3 n=1 Tax=Liolophura sinensis TaxID=3198878 RepID=UPI00315985B8
MGRVVRGRTVGGSPLRQKTGKGSSETELEGSRPRQKTVSGSSKTWKCHRQEEAPLVKRANTYAALLQSASQPRFDMPLQVHGDELSILVDKLEQYLPEAIRVQSNIRSVLGGWCDGQKIWVDDWPEVRAVVCVVDSHNAKFGYWRNRLEIYCCDFDALESVLSHDPVLDWKTEFLVAGVSKECMKTVAKVVRKKHVGTVVPFDTELYIYYLPKSTRDTLIGIPDRPLPSDYRVGTVDSCLSTSLSQIWEPDGGPLCERYIRALINNMPSVAVYTADGIPIAYCLLYYYWALALLYVQPEYRGKGLGKLVTTEMIKKIEQKAPKQTPYLVVATNNERALAMYEKLGFRRVNKLLYWFLFKPISSESSCLNFRV